MRSSMPQGALKNSKVHKKAKPVSKARRCKTTKKGGDKSATLGAKAPTGAANRSTHDAKSARTKAINANIESSMAGVACSHGDRLKLPSMQSMGKAFQTEIKKKAEDMKKKRAKDAMEISSLSRSLEANKQAGVGY